MLIINQITLLREIITSQKQLGRSIGFVPTMGALHAGHLSLIKQSKTFCDLSICSIFVNPTQFNQTADLKKYPRTPHADICLLEKEACDILFMPTTEEIYPDDGGEELEVDLGHLDKVLEGAFRPGHFQGVVQVVSRLLDITVPDKIFMGQKDFQQLAIIRHMIAQQKRPIELIMGPTVREVDGLAMSSRNVRLSPENREKAPIIYQLLQAAKASLNEISIDEIEEKAISSLKNVGFQPEYFSIVDANTLERIKDPAQSKTIVVCTALWAGEVRLIDNLFLK